jgi:hypothetical protein
MASKAGPAACQARNSCQTNTTQHSCQHPLQPTPSAHLDVQLEPEAEGPKQVVAPPRLHGVRQPHRLAADLNLEAHGLEDVRSFGGEEWGWGGSMGVYCGWGV